MSPNPHLKGLITTAVSGASRLNYTYPQHFHDIEQAKAHISHILAEKNFIYVNALRLSAQDEEYIADRTQFIIAAKAYVQGEFGLKVGLPNRADLRSAIDHDISRIMSLIMIWPRIFATVGSTKNFITSVCMTQRFIFTRFDGVSAEKFRGYVVYNTAKLGFERGLFNVQFPGQDWVRNRQKVIVQKPVLAQRTQVHVAEKIFASLREAIEADISRLTPQLPTWPPLFTDMNAARTWLMDVAFKRGFRYSGWPELELHRYRMFVNFNAAKYALRRGEFEVGSVKELLKGNGKVEGAERKCTVLKIVTKEEEGKSGESNASVESTAPDHLVETPVACNPVNALATDFDAVSLFHGKAIVADPDTVTSVHDTVAYVNNKTTAVGNDLPSFNTTEPTVTIFDDITKNLNKVEKTAEIIDFVPVEKEDPFKALLADLQRGYILKAAFD